MSDAALWRCQPLMGARGETEGEREEGGGRRIRLKKNDITCAERGRARERGRESEGARGLWTVGE